MSPLHNPQLTKDLAALHGMKNTMSSKFVPQLLSVEEAKSRARRGSLSLKALPTTAAVPTDEESDTIVDSNNKSNKPITISGSLSTAVDDLVALEEPSAPNILKCLKERYMKSIVYTSVGSCLLSVNPYEWIVGLYDKSKAVEYQYANGANSTAELQPHVFGIAANAYSSLRASGKNQSILVTGESGAGKTENTKKCIQYLVDVAAPGSDLESRILSTNPIISRSLNIN